MAPDIHLMLLLRRMPLMRADTRCYARCRADMLLLLMRCALSAQTHIYMFMRCREPRVYADAGLGFAKAVVDDRQGANHMSMSGELIFKAIADPSAPCPRCCCCYVPSASCWEALMGARRKKGVVAIRRPASARCGDVRARATVDPRY